MRIALPEYWTIPWTKRWLHLKGHIAYGMMTDDSWQHDFTNKRQKYADHVLYHSKAGYLKIGNEDSFFPISLELGLEMACEFGGKPYRRDGHGNMQRIPTGTGVKDFRMPSYRAAATLQTESTPTAPATSWAVGWRV